MSYFFDSYAIIESIKNNPNYQKFKNVRVITSSLNIAEVYYFLLEYSSEEEADNTIKNLNLGLIEIDKDIAIEASKLRFKQKKLRLSYADCIGYIIALRNNLLFLTGDDAFEKFVNVEFLK